MKRRYIGYCNRHDPRFTPALPDETRLVRCGTFKKKIDASEDYAETLEWLRGEVKAPSEELDPNE